MAWTLKSDKTGREYDFDDGVAPEEALKWMDEVAEKGQEWGNTLETVPRAMQTGLLRAQAGVARLGEDFIVKPLQKQVQSLMDPIGAMKGTLGPQEGSPFAQAQRDKLSAAEGLLKTETVGMPSLGQQAVQSAALSLGEGAADVAMGAGAAVKLAKAGVSTAKAVGTAVESGLRSMASREGVKEYEEQREAGQTPGVAVGHATIQAIAEYLPEKMAWTPVLKLLRSPDGNIRNALTGFLFREVLGEEITTTTEWINRKLSRQPDMTLAELAHEMQVTALSAGIAGPIQGGMAGATYGVALRGRIREEMREPSRREPRIAGESSEISGGAMEPTLRPEVTVGESEKAYKDNGRGRLSEGTVLGESPGGSKSSPRDLPVELQLDLLRTAWTAYQNKTAFDTAEDRIAKRQEFVRRKMEVEQSLALDPAGRAFVRETDLELGLRVPTIADAIETEIDAYSVMTPRQLEELRVAREGGEGEVAGPVPLMPGATANELGVDRTLPGVEQPLAKEQLYNNVNVDLAVQNSFAGKPAAQSGGKFDGLVYEDVLAQAQAGDVVVFTKDIRKNAHAASAVQKVIEELTRTYLPGYRVFIGDFPTDPTINSHAFPIDEKTLAFTLPKVGGMNSLQSYFNNLTNRFDAERETFNIMDTALHEFSHLIHFAHWKEAPTYEKVSVAKEFHADLEYARNASVKDALHRLYAPKTAESILEDYVANGGDQNARFGSVQSKLRISSNPNYWYNFNEWIAHKGVRYFFTRLGVTPENRTFFQRFVLKMKQFFAGISATQFKPGTSFATWFDNIAARESGAALAMRAEEVSAAKKELLDQGLLPELADMLTAVHGSDIAAIRRKAREAKIARNSPSDVRLEHRAMSAVTDALAENTFDGVLSKLSTSFSFAKDIAQHPVFQVDGASRWHFFDSVTQLVFGKNVQSIPDGDRFQIYAFVGHGGDVQVEFEKATGTLRLLEPDYSGASSTSGVQAIAMLSALRQLAAEGATSVKVNPNEHPLWTALGADLESGALEIPYFLHQPPVKPPEAGVIALPALQMPAGLDSLGRRLKAPFARSMANGLARTQAVLDKTLGAFQLIKLNADVPGMLEEKQALRNRMAYRHKWLKRANATVDRWAFELPKTESVKLARVLYDESESGTWLSTIQPDPNKPGERIFVLDPQEISRRGLAPETAELYSQIRNDFMLFADEWHKVAVWEIARSELAEVVWQSLAEAMRNGTTLGDYHKIFRAAVASIKNPQEQARVLKRFDETNDAFDSWKAKPYMPHTRFGRFGVLVRDAANGKTKYFAGYENAAEARAAAEDLKTGKFAGDAVSTTYLEDVPYMFAGLPPIVLDAMKKRLGLDQSQLDQFSEVMSKLSFANSFVHRADKKKGIEGYSQDALRAYSDYFRRGAAFIARTKSQPELDDAMGKLKHFISMQTSRTDIAVDTTKYGRLHDWFTKLHGYLNNPGNEYGELKSMLALWHFGFNASTAVMNSMQVGMVTLPYLQDRYGARAFKELTRAYKDVLGMYFKNGKLAADETAMLDHALEAGFRDESQATVIAQIADGSALARAGAASAWNRWTNGVNHYAMWMFGKAELLNRDVTLLAAYRLRKTAQFHGAFDRDAFDFARTTTEDTHNEYSQENRPEIMRGGAGVVLQFMHYVQNMLFMMLGGDQSWWKLLLVQLGLAGAMGLPFGSDAASMAKLLGRRVFGEDWDLDRELREYISAVGANPDWFMRGMSSDVFGFDLSRRISLGDVVPGAQAVGSHRKTQEVMYSAVGDVGGPAVSLLLNAFKFMSEEDKTSWEAYRGILPTALKNFGNASKALVEGEVKTRTGVKVFEPDLWDVTGMAAGWRPKEVSEFYEARTLEQEQRAFWLTRRQALLGIYSHAVIERKMDREVMADFMKRLRDFNENAPDPSLKVTAQTLKASVRSRLLAKTKAEAGIGTQMGMAIRQTYQHSE